MREITTKKSEPEFVRAMAFICKAAGDDPTRPFFNSILLLTGKEENTVEVFATDGRRLHRAVFSYAEITSLGLIGFVCSREDTANYTPVGFDTRAKNKWTFENRFMDFPYPNVFKVIPEIGENWSKLEFADAKTDKFSTISSYYVTHVLHGKNAYRMNGNYLLDLDAYNNTPDYIYICDDNQDILSTWASSVHTVKPVVFTFNGSRDMSAVIMPMAGTEREKRILFS